MCPDAPYFIILLCVMPDSFTHERGISAAMQWINYLVGYSVQYFFIAINFVFFQFQGKRGKKHTCHVVRCMNILCLLCILCSSSSDTNMIY